MPKHLALAEAVKLAEREMGRPIKHEGYEQREIAGKAVDVLFFSADYSEGDVKWTEHRISVYVDGKMRAGLVI